jgi:hypothetical protein
MESYALWKAIRWSGQVDERVYGILMPLMRATNVLYCRYGMLLRLLLKLLFLCKLMRVPDTV